MVINGFNDRDDLFWCPFNCTVLDVIAAAAALARAKRAETAAGECITEMVLKRCFEILEGLTQSGSFSTESPMLFYSSPEWTNPTGSR